MKRKMVIAMALTMLLCGCSEATNDSAKDSTTEKTTATTATSEETTAEATTNENEEKTTTTDAEENTTVADEESTTADSESVTASLNDDIFEGLYYDKNDSNNSLSIDRKNDQLYNVHITHKKTDTVTEEWFFTGEFNGRQVLNYENCCKSTITTSEDGSVMSGTDYLDGTGYIKISETGIETGIIWVDDKENAGAEDFFIKQ